MNMKLLTATALLTLTGMMAPVISAEPDSIFTATTSNNFADVQIDIENAITNRGFVVDFKSRIGEMLNRTAADTGAGEAVYIHADAWQFCSSILSRKMVEVSADNIAYCPYVVFAYETVANPGTVVVGFRNHVTEDQSSRGILKEIDTHLEAIVLESVE